MKGTIYSTVTGEVYTAIDASDGASSIVANFQLYPDAAILYDEFLDGGEWFVSDGVKTARPVASYDTAQSDFPEGGSISITNIPAGTRAIGPGFDQIIDDGFLEWASVVDGDFRIELINFPYRPEVIHAHFGNV